MAEFMRIVAALLVCGFGVAQQTPQRLSFEVPSVKLSTSGDNSYSNFPMGPGEVYRSNGGRLTARDFPLISFLFFAYKISGDQGDAVRSQLPGRATTDRFDIEAETDGNPAKDTKDQMRLMMQSLLAEPFGLKARYETRQVPVFELTLAKPGKMGPQLRLHSAEEPCASALESADGPPQGIAIGGGFPEVCGGFLGMMPNVAGRARIGARNVTMEFIGAHLISNFLNRPVIDGTGLSGKFDVVIEFSLELNGPRDGDREPDPNGPASLEALNEQLGLKAESQKGPAQVLVIDHLERPSEN